MKVAYIGNFEPEYSTENDVRKAFEHLGHEVKALQENQLPVVSNLSSTEIDMVLITSTWDDAINLPYWLGFVKDCAIKGIPTATLHLDTFWGTSRGGREWWLNPMFHTAYIFTADGDYEKEWKLLGKNHIWLPAAIRHDAAHFGKFRKEYQCDVAFVGSNGEGYHEDVWQYRKDLLNVLRNICQRNGWSFKNPGGDDPKINRDDDMNDFYASASIIVGDSLCLKKEDSRYWSDRVPETWGRGGFLIMPEIKAQIAMYEHAQPFYKWGDWDDLEECMIETFKRPELISRYKESNMELVKEHHTYVNRVQTILDTVFEEVIIKGNKKE